MPKGEIEIEYLYKVLQTRIIDIVRLKIVNWLKRFVAVVNEENMTQFELYEMINLHT